MLVRIILKNSKEKIISFKEKLKMLINRIVAEINSFDFIESA
jgi:hypothetical protein